MVPILLRRGARLSAGMTHHRQGIHQLVVQIIGNCFKGIHVTESAGSGDRVTFCEGSMELKKLLLLYDYKFYTLSQRRNRTDT